jgi:ABC-type multidrug transport system fused ATPase/permease subunit
MFDKKNIPITKRPLYYWIFSRYHGLQLLLLAIILVSVFFRVVPLELQKRIVNEAISKRDEHLLLWYCGLYIGAVVLAGLSKYLINMLQVVIGQKILIGLRTGLFLHVLHLPLQRYRGLRPGSAISAMTGELNAIGAFLGQALAVPLTSILTYVVVFSYMFSLSHMLTLVTIAVYPFELIAIPLLQKKFNGWNQKRITTVREMSDTVNEAINGIVEIQSYNRFEFEKNRIRRLIDKLYRITITLSIYKFGIKFSGNFFQALGPFLLFLIGGHLAINGQFSLGALVAFLSAHEKLYDPWQELRLFYQEYQNAHVVYQQITRLFDHQEALPPPATRPASTTPACLDIAHIYYKLPGNITLLRDVSLTIHRGQHIALVGTSGCGKSTLALLLARLYRTTEGTIHLDGEDMSCCTAEHISSKIAMIPQHPFIFSGTISENIMYGLCDAAIGADASLKIKNRMRLIIENIGLEKDVVWMGMSSTPPIDKAHQLKAHILKMRQIVHQELKQQFGEVVEFYDRDKFLYYATLRDNLIFGESLSGQYQIERLPTNQDFITLMKQTDLESDLIGLGFALARITLDILQQTATDESFFCNNPMAEEEIGKYENILSHLDNAVPLTREEQNHLIILALRYIPAKHGQIRLQPEFERNVLAARKYFLSEIKHVVNCLCQYDLHDHLCKNHRVSLEDPPHEFNTYCYSGYLYNHNIRTNILLGSVKKTFEDILQIKDLAWNTFKRYGLMEEIIDLGLDFFVGSQGGHLSGGQKQKIAIARALLTDRPILIMDEATASLDNISQSMIQDFISTYFKEKTIISIIHRLDLAKFYDLIVVMDNGTIVETGTYDDLMQEKGAFFQLYHNNNPQSTQKE